jgi:oligosaccharide repeat unit polymerase
MPPEVEPFRFADFTLGHVPADIWFAWGMLTVAMLGYWYYRFRQSGVLTFDVFFVGLYLYVPIVFMSLFAFSPLNSHSTGDWHWKYLPYIREAFYVSVFGIVVFATTALLASRNHAPLPGLRALSYSLNDFWLKPWGITTLLGLIGILAVGVITTLGIGSSRDAAMTNTELRPMAHLFATFAVIGMYLFLVEGYRRNSWLLTLIGCVLVVALIAFGTRKLTVGTLLYYSAMRLINLRTYRAGRAFAAMGLMVVLLVGMAIGMEAYRIGDFSPERLAAAPVNTLFGNNLSELRDFAWILSGWNHEPLMGQTYASGFLSFIPSYLLPERKAWSWGLFSTETTGLTGGTHPGLRPTIFAEAYFNFDLLGVLVFGIVLGFLFGRLSAVAERVMQSTNQRERLFGLLCVFLYFECFLRLQQTPGYFVSYIEVLFVFAGLVGASLIRYFSQNHAPVIALPTRQPAMESAT